MTSLGIHKEKKEKYEIPYLCSNCFEEGDIEIEKGTSVEETPCPYCEVDSLHHNRIDYEIEYKESDCEHTWILLAMYQDSKGRVLDFFCEECLDLLRLKNLKFMLKDE